MEERRQYQRNEVNEPACIFGDGSSHRCRVVNISPDGAAVELSADWPIRDRFQLMTLGDRIIRDCRMIWRAQNRMGIQFIVSARVSD